MSDRAGITPTSSQSADTRTACRADYNSSQTSGVEPSPERARADLALTVALDKVGHLQEVKARYTANTADDAYRLMMAAQEAAQAMLSAFVSFRERVAVA